MSSVLETTSPAPPGVATAGGRSSWAVYLAIAAAVLVAGLSVGFLAARQSFSDDELHTVGGADHATVQGMWHGYRTSEDASPPADYVASWAATRVLGTSRVAWRVPSILGWLLATACLGLFLRRLHPVAVFVGALVPTASALVGLGMFARPYALELGSLAVAFLAWQRTLDRPRSAGAAAAMTAGLASAVLFHYTAAAAVALLAVAELVAVRCHPGRSRRVLLLIASSLVPLAISLALIRGASALQGEQDHTFALTRIPAFYVSTALPAALLALVVVAGLVWALWAEPRSTFVPGRTSALSQEEVALGVGLTVLMPAFAVGGMWLARGHYFHRYGVAALIGAAILLAGAVDVVARRSSVFSVAAVMALLASCVAANVKAGHETATNDAVRHELIDLRVPPGDGLVVFLEVHQFALARSDGHVIAKARMRVADANQTLPGTAAAKIDLDRLVAATAEPVAVVGTESHLARATKGRTWKVRVVAHGEISYDGVRHEIVRADVSRP